MKGNVRRDTAPELAVRRELHHRGLRYRVDHPLPMARRRRADIAFTRLKIAVFIDGCFWHGCPLHGASPSRNSDYWLPKLARNKARDAETTQMLSEAGWLVMRFWEHESSSSVADSIEAVVKKTRETASSS
jgi:DNA mismatch endonuclease (patch repair protein)